MAGVGLVGLLSKLHKWDDSAMLFDGSSLGAIFFRCGLASAMVADASAGVQLRMCLGLRSTSR